MKIDFGHNVSDIYFLSFIWRTIPFLELCVSSLHYGDATYRCRIKFLFVRKIKSRTCGLIQLKKMGIQTELSTLSKNNGVASVLLCNGVPRPALFQLATMVPNSPSRCISTMGEAGKSISQDASTSISDVAPRIKFKRLDKTARHIMQACNYSFACFNLLLLWSR